MTNINILELNLILIITYGVLFLSVGRNKFLRILFLSITTIQLIIINGLRDRSVGTDTFRYERHFFKSSEVNSFMELKNIDNELGFFIVQKLVSYFIYDFNTWLFIIAFFLFTSLAFFIYKFSKGILISYLLFVSLGFYDFTFTGIRQSIAIILILLSYKYILNKNLMKYSLMILLAVSFHMSAIIFFPMYFLAHIKWKKVHVVFLVILYSLIYIFKIQIGKLLTTLYFEENSSEIIMRYTSSGSIGTLSILLLVILIGGFIFNNPIRNAEKENIVLTNITIIAFFIQSLSSFSYLFTRLNMYYLVFIIIYIPYIFSKLNYVNIKLSNKELLYIKGVLKSVLIIILCVYYYNTIIQNGSNILPYKFVEK